MKNNKSLAVIGSLGMLGSDLVKYLQRYHQKVIGIDRNNYNQYQGHCFDVVINANGNSKKYWANDHILADFVASTVSVYNSLFDFPCNTYIYISSSDVYENHSSEKTTYESEIIDPKNLSPYGLHKYLSECIIQNVMTDYIILRSSMILGTTLKKGLLFDILHKSRLFITDKSRYQMITTNELAKIIHFLLNHNITKKIFNIGGRGVVAISEISHYIKKSVDFPQDGETHIYQTNVSKLHKIYHLKTSVEYLQDFLGNLAD